MLQFLVIIFVHLQNNLFMTAYRFLKLWLFIEDWSVMCRNVKIINVELKNTIKFFYKRFDVDVIYLYIETRKILFGDAIVKKLVSYEWTASKLNICALFWVFPGLFPSLRPSHTISFLFFAQKLIRFVHAADCQKARQIARRNWIKIEWPSNQWVWTSQCIRNVVAGMVK